MLASVPFDRNGLAAFLLDMLDCNLISNLHTQLSALRSLYHDAHSDIKQQSFKLDEPV